MKLIAYLSEAYVGKKNKFDSRLTIPSSSHTTNLYGVLAVVGLALGGVEDK